MMNCRTHRIAAATCAFAVYGLCTGAAPAQTVVTFQEGAPNMFGTYTGTADNELFGYSSSLFDFNNGAGSSLQWGTEVLGQQRRIIMRFENLQAPAGQPVVATAKVRLQKGSAPSPTRPSFTVEVFRIADANAGWNEGNKTIANQVAGDTGSDWNHLDHTAGPTWIGGPGLATPGTSYLVPALDATVVDPADPIDTPYEWDLDPAMVQTWVDGGTNAGLLFIGAEDVDGTAMPIYSRNNNAYPPGRPALEVRFEPLGAEFTTVPVTEVVAMEFGSLPGRTYALESTTDPVNESWDPAGAVLTGSGQPMQFFDPAGGSPEKIYRISFE